jgi:hypothetical protein
VGAGGDGNLEASEQLYAQGERTRARLVEVAREEIEEIEKDGGVSLDHKGGWRR